MADGQRPGAEAAGQRSKTPEERSNYTLSSDPMDSIPKFSSGNSAWLSVPKKGALEVTIVSRKKDEASGEYIYQVKGLDGELYKKGEWMRQEKLSECS